MLVVGEKDAQNGTVTVRDRIEGDLGALSLDDAMAKLRQEVDAKTVRQVAETGSEALVDRETQSEY
jgi:threonyl-tRNA synthetase